MVSEEVEMDVERFSKEMRKLCSKQFLHLAMIRKIHQINSQQICLQIVGITDLKRSQRLLIQLQMKSLINVDWSQGIQDFIQLFVAFLKFKEERSLVQCSVLFAEVPDCFFPPIGHLNVICFPEIQNCYKPYLYPSKRQSQFILIELSVRPTHHQRQCPGHSSQIQVTPNLV